MAKKVTNKESVSKASEEVLDTANTQENQPDASADTQENAGDNPDANQVDDTSKEALTYFEDENGNKFGFTKRTPDKFRFNGVIKTQAQWLQDEDAMEMLIYGNSMYINQLKN